jgi:hypothetical protein
MTSDETQVILDAILGLKDSILRIADIQSALNRENNDLLRLLFERIKDLEKLK